MKPKSKYTVTYSRDAESGWWVAEIPDVAGTVTQGRTIEQSRARIREALEAMLDADVSGVELIDDVELPKALLRKVESAHQANEEVSKVHKRAANQMQQAARALIKHGLSLRDAGELLGVTRQRVSQLVNDDVKSA